MNCLPMQKRSANLLRRWEGLQKEEESTIQNTKAVTRRAKQVIQAQESLLDNEAYLRSYPIASEEVGILSNTLTKVNCELEIALSRHCHLLETPVDIFEDSDTAVEETLKDDIVSPVATQCVGTNTEEVVDQVQECDVLITREIYNLEEESILEMKHLHGESPLNFWLGYYSDNVLHAHLKKVEEMLQSGMLRCLEPAPAVGQYIICRDGSVCRGYVLSVCWTKIVVLDVDTGLIRFVDVHNIWEMDEQVSSLPPQAILCKLWKISDDLPWCKDLDCLFKKCLSQCNLVVTVKNIIPGCPPTFVVDVDAHDGTMLDVNMSEWIEEYVLPGLEKLEPFMLSGKDKKILLESLDPYAVYKTEDSLDSEGSVAFSEDDVLPDAVLDVQVESPHVQQCREQLSKGYEVVKSASIKCSMEKGTTLTMSFLQGNDPWSFSLSCVSNEKIQELKTAIAKKAEDGELISYTSVPTVGDFAIGKYNGEFIRVVVTDMSSGVEGDVVIVVDVDSGNLNVQSLDNLWLLDEEFAELPARAVSCSLWNITKETTYWNTALGHLFREVMTNGTLSVLIRDVSISLGDWKHIVEIQISSDCNFDVSEWIMFSVVPKLDSFKNFPDNDHNVLLEIENLKPCNFYSDQISNSKKQENSLNDHVLLASSDDSSVFWSEKESSPVKNDVASTSSLLCFESSLREPPNNPNIKNYTKLEREVEHNVHDLILKEPVCVKTPGSKCYAFLSTVSDPGNFYVHVVSPDNTLMDKLQEVLQEYYLHTFIEYHTKKEAKQLLSQYCAVFYDKQWCRGLVIDWFDESRDDVSVFIVDYGVHATVSFHVIQSLKSEFYKYPIFAQKCRLARIVPPKNTYPWSSKSIQGFINALDNKVVYEIIVENFSEKDKVLSVFLSHRQGEEMKCINDYMVDAGFAESVGINNSSGIVERQRFHSIVCPAGDSGVDDIGSDNEDWVDDYVKVRNNTEMQIIECNSVEIPSVGEQLPIVITDVVNISSFYGVVMTHTKYRGEVRTTDGILIELSKKIGYAVQAGQLKHIRSPPIGSIVVACFNKDKVWYRARITSVVDDNGFAEVFFVDYGNNDHVHTKFIREIKKEFCILPFQALRFFIKDFNLSIFKGGEPTEKALTILDSLVGKKCVLVKIVNLINDDISAEVWFEGENIGLKMLEYYNKECTESPHSSWWQ